MIYCYFEIPLLNQATICNHGERRKMTGNSIRVIADLVKNPCPLPVVATCVKKTLIQLVETEFSGRNSQLVTVLEDPTASIIDSLSLRFIQQFKS